MDYIDFAIYDPSVTDRPVEESVIAVIYGDDATSFDYRRVMRIHAVRCAMGDLLTPAQHRCLSLSLAGLTQEAVANSLGVAVSTVSRTLARAKRRLAQYLVYGYMPHAPIETIRRYLDTI